MYTYPISKHQRDSKRRSQYDGGTDNNKQKDQYQKKSFDILAQFYMENNKNTHVVPSKQDHSKDAKYKVEVITKKMNHLVNLFTRRLLYFSNAL